MASLQKTLDYLRRRKKAYVAHFVPGTAAYLAFVDLARFCRAFGGDVLPGDHDRTLILAGRREAFFRIYQHLNLEPDDLAKLYRAAVLADEGDE